jgi:hypothetical protein
MKDGGSSKINYIKKIIPSPGYSDAGEQDECDLVFTAALQNIQLALPNYAEDDVLNVEVNTDGFVVVTGKFGSCGTLTTPKTLTLKRCIEDGKRYKATIVTISSSACTVKVRRLF